MPLYAFSLFLPSIINHVSTSSFDRDGPLCTYLCLHFFLARYILRADMERSILTICVSPSSGFRATPANLLTVPVYAFACLVTCLVGFLADRHGHRGYFNM
jgi:hypothetical protein